MDVRLLREDDAQAYYDLRLRGLHEHPEAFATSPEEWERKSLDDVAERLRSSLPDFPRFGAFIGGEIVGIGNLNRYQNEKSRHRALITGMYVAPEARGQGVGRVILDAIIDYARKQDGIEDLILAVVVGNAPARAIYTAAGFTTWGVDPRYLKISDRYHDLEWMVLSLKNLG